MDIRDILKSFDNLSEAKTTTDKGVTTHKGDYGREFDTDDEGNAVVKKVKSTEPKPKGRRPDPDRPKLGKDDPKNKKVGDLFGRTTGAVPKGKKGTTISGKAQSHSDNKKDDGTGDEETTSKKSLKEYFDQMDEALYEAALAVQPLPATAQQKQQQQMAGKPSFMIKDPANPNMPAITTQDPAVVQAAKNGTMTMQKPGAAPTAPGATPAAGAGSQVKPMEEDGMDEGVLDTVKSAVGLGKKPSATTAEKNAAFHAANKGRNMPSSGNASVDYDRFTGRDKVTEKDVGKHNNATTGFDALVRKLTPKYGKEAATKIAGAQLKKMSEAEAPQHFAQSSPLSTANRGVLEGKKGVNPFAKKDDKDEKKGAAPKKGVNPFAKKEVKEAAKPDFLDLDKDGNKKEPMKKAATDKKKVKEGMDSKLQAARLRGKSHALSKEAYNCHYDDMEESRCYHEGFKEGLDECYGQMPILGRTAVDEMGSEVGTMAGYGARTPAMEDDMYEMDKTSYMKQQAINTPGDTFKAFGQTMRDSNVLDEFAFEALDKQLNAILEGKEVSEGMTVSISKGQQGSPDSVSVSAQDGEADQLLSIIKSAGMGLFGGDEQNGYGAPQGSAGAHGGISVVDDHDGMMALMKKLSGGGEMQGGGDYEDEEGHEGHGEEEHMHGHEETCESCGGMMEAGHSCGSKEMVDEVESEDQMMYNVAEDNPPDSGADNTNADVAGQVGSDKALATVDGEQDMASPTNEAEDETGEEAGKKKEEETVAESFANLYKKLAFLSEESTEKKDEKAEKAGKKVANDIEYDEGHKGKDDNKAEKAGKKVTKDIEYDDKKDEKYKKDKKVDESYANSADDTFEADIDFMTKVISGGLNKQKSTGQTTIPVVNGQKNRMGVDGLGSPMKESNDLLRDYRKLSGL